VSGIGEVFCRKVVPGWKVTVSGLDEEEADSRVKGIIKFCAVKLSHENEMPVAASMTGRDWVV
jgi:hypothetical protein